MIFISIGIFNAFLGIYKTSKISNRHPGVMRTFYGVDQIIKYARFKLIKMAGLQKMHDLLQVFILVDNSNRIIVTSPCFNLFFRQTKQKKVFITHFFTNFNVGAIQCADSDRAVHHQLHVAGTRSFLAGGGYLFG